MHPHRSLYQGSFCVCTQPIEKRGWNESHKIFRNILVMLRLTPWIKHYFFYYLWQHVSHITEKPVIGFLRHWQFMPDIHTTKQLARLFHAWLYCFTVPKLGAVACLLATLQQKSVQWGHNERDGVSNHRRLDCLLDRLFWRRSKKTSKLRVTGLCAGNSPVTGEFPAQRASNAENVSIWWRHHVDEWILMKFSE